MTTAHEPLHLPTARTIAHELIARSPGEAGEEAKDFVKNVLDNGWQPYERQSADERLVWSLAGWLGWSVDDDPFQMHQAISSFFDVL